MAQLRMSMPVSLNNGTVTMPENDTLVTTRSAMSVQLPMESVSQLPMDTVNLAQLPATLPVPKHEVKLEEDPDQYQQEPPLKMQLNPADTIKMTEDIIKQQQKKIEVLQMALQRSQLQLQMHQNLLKEEHKKQDNEVKQEANSPANPNSSMKMLLAQQLQNKQLASQIQHLQAMQHKVQEQQAAVMTAVNGSSSNSPGLVTPVTSAQAGVNSQMAQNSSNGFLVNDHR